jgi:hypothetical protein
LVEAGNDIRTHSCYADRARQSIVRPRFRLFPLRVVGEYLDWQGHSPEEVQAMKDAIAGLEPIDD